MTGVGMREFREGLGVSVEELAAAGGWHPSWVSAREESPWTIDARDAQAMFNAVLAVLEKRPGFPRHVVSYSAVSAPPDGFVRDDGPQEFTRAEHDYLLGRVRARTARALFPLVVAEFSDVLGAPAEQGERLGGVFARWRATSDDECRGIRVSVGDVIVRWSPARPERVEVAGDFRPGIAATTAPELLCHVLPPEVFLQDLKRAEGSDA